MDHFAQLCAKILRTFKKNILASEGLRYPNRGFKMTAMSKLVGTKAGFKAIKASVCSEIAKNYIYDMRTEKIS